MCLDIEAANSVCSWSELALSLTREEAFYLAARILRVLSFPDHRTGSPFDEETFAGCLDELRELVRKGVE